MSKKAKKQTPKQPPKQAPKRKFTDTFKVGDRVYITRTEHGWYDGALEGEITYLTACDCTVTADGSDYEIKHPRDITKVHAW
jgi:hypothetical protein